MSGQNMRAQIDSFGHDAWSHIILATALAVIVPSCCCTIMQYNAQCKLTARNRYHRTKIRATQHPTIFIGMSKMTSEMISLIFIVLVLDDQDCDATGTRRRNCRKTRSEAPPVSAVSQVFLKQPSIGAAYKVGLSEENAA